MHMSNHYYMEGLYDFYLFDFEEDARGFSEDYNNVYFSYTWLKWVASKSINNHEL